MNSRTADKVIIRMPSGMRPKIAGLAKTRRRSMNAELVQLIQKELDAAEYASTEKPYTHKGAWCPSVGELCVHAEHGIGKIEDFDLDLNGCIAANVKFMHAKHICVELYPNCTLSPFLLSF